MKISEVLRYYPFLIYNNLSKNDIYKNNIRRNKNLIVNFEVDQKNRVNKLKNYSIKHTDYYNKHSNFPIIDKNEIQDNINMFLSSEYQKEDLFKITTSGSYGTPSIFYRNKKKKMSQISDVLYYGHYNNYFFGIKHAFIRGVKKSKKSLLIQNEIHLSPKNLNQRAMEEYYIQLKKVTHVIGFPSVILNFIEFCEEYKLKKLVNISGVTCTAEPLTLEDRDKISRFFNCPVLTRYASEEVGIIANRLPSEDFYRINDKSVKLDIYKLETDEIQEDGLEGRIVVTDLYSHAMPLINYDTGDLGIVEEVVIESEKHKVLKTITGRLVEQLYDDKDEKISPFAINVYLKEFDKIGQFQFIQSDFSEYTLLITNTLEKNYSKELLKGLKNILGSNANITISFVQEIPSLSSGKRPYIRNEYKKD